MAEGGGGGGGGVAEGAETSLLYVRFRAAAPELRTLMEVSRPRLADGGESPPLMEVSRPC
jgi:hypothetical protein